MGARSKTRILATYLAAAMLAACSDAPAPPTPEIAWHDCDPSVSDPDSIKQLGERLQCATVAVPLDHDDPRKGTIDFALSRVAAGDPSRRRNAIFVNPGGPGGDGLRLGVRIGALFALADPSTPLGAQLRRVSDEYDVIGFSPRGVGSSTNLTCHSDEPYRVAFLPTVLFTPENLAASYENQLLNARACQANPLTPYINTDAVVRDMDLVRRALGDEKLSYLGYSYGTWLGIWYASRFPERVDRMVIDSVFDYATGTLTTIGLNQPPALQFVLDEIVSPYAATKDATFGLGTSPQEIRGIFGSLPVELQTVLSGELYLRLFSQRRADEVVVQLGAAKGVAEVMREFPDAPPDEVMRRIAERRFAPDDAIDQQMREAAEALFFWALELEQEDTEPVEVPADTAVNIAVVCNDTPSPTDPAYWNQQIAELREVAPAFFGGLNCTDEWGGPTVVQPDVDRARRVPNILMVQDQYDPATPLAGALATYELLGNASLIYNTRSYTHGVFPTNEACVDGAVADFFVADEIPGHFVLECEGKGLLDGAPAAAARAASAPGSELPEVLRAQAVRGESGDASGAYLDPELASALVQQIHDEIRDA
ncbi:MAG TPA: alpha/beta fold hydrolase, partial [Candidatus Binatia bacterium]